MAIKYWKKRKHWKQRYYYNRNSEPNLFSFNINELHWFSEAFTSCFCWMQVKTVSAEFSIIFLTYRINKKGLHPQKPLNTLMYYSFCYLRKIPGHLWPSQPFAVSFWKVVTFGHWIFWALSFVEEMRKYVLSQKKKEWKMNVVAYYFS